MPMQIRSSIALAVLIVVILLLSTDRSRAALPDGPAPPVIADIRVVIDGATARAETLTRLARGLIRLKAGDALTPQALAASTENLKRSRRFAAVHADTTSRPEGEVLIFTLTPFRHIRAIHVKGNYPIFEKDILGRLSVFPGDPYTQAILDSQVETIVRRFRRGGYIAPRVTVAPLAAGEDGSDEILIAIDKGACYRPGELRFEGNHAVSGRALGWRMKTWRSPLLFGSGRFSEYLLKKDLETLLQYYRRKGYADAELTYRIDGIDDQRRVHVTVRVDEGTRYRVSFVGNRRFWDLTLKKDLTLALDGNRSGIGVRKSIRNIKRRYHQAGFMDVAVRAEKLIDSHGNADDLDLRFVIDEGPATIVEAVTITGNQALAEEEIRDQVLTRPPGLLNDGAFVPETLDEDVYAVSALYTRQGFQEARVASDLSFNPDKTRVTVDLDVAEGLRTTVAAITIDGLTAVPEPEAHRGLVLKVGDPFRRAALETDRETIASLIAEEGYPHATVNAATTFNDDRTQVHITYSVTPGPQVFLGGVFVSGNLRTDEQVIRRELAVAPGTPLALRTLHDGQRRLRDLDIFDSVGYRIFGLAEGAETVDMLVDIRESPPFYLQASTGYQSDSGLFARLKAGDRNIFGLNKHLWGSAEISETGYRVETRLTEPRFLGTLTSASVGAFHEQSTEFNQSFGVRTTGGSLSFGRSLGDHLTSSLSFSVEQRSQFSVADRDADTVDENSRTIFVTTPYLRYDSRDSFVRPTRGLYSSIGVDISKGMHHQIDDFVRYQFDNRYYRTLIDGFTLAALARIGQVVSYTESSDVPDDQLFYLGGIQDVRGYEENLLRVDGDGNAVGGRTAMVGSLEARIDLGMNLELTTFFDIGSVQDATVDEGSDHFRMSVGLGLRYITPIGPMGLLYGHKLDPQDDESSGRFHISIGYSF